MTKKEFYIEMALFIAVIAVCSWVYVTSSEESIETVSASDSIAVKVTEVDTVKVDTILVKS